MGIVYHTLPSCHLQRLYSLPDTDIGVYFAQCNVLENRVIEEYTMLLNQSNIFSHPISAQGFKMSSAQCYEALLNVIGLEY